MIVYVHGFASAGGGKKLEILRKFFPENTDPVSFGADEVVSPTFPVSPREAVRQLKGILNEGSILIGTSLGGFYSAYLAATEKKLVGKALLLNPAVRPSEGLRRHLGVNRNYKTGEEFLFTEEHLEELRVLEREMSGLKLDPRVVKLAIGSKDELSDPVKASQFYGLEPTIYEDGHRFSECFEDAVFKHLL